MKYNSAYTIVVNWHRHHRAIASAAALCWDPSVSTLPNIADIGPAVENAAVVAAAERALRDCVAAYSAADPRAMMRAFTSAYPPLPVHRLVLLEMRGDRIGRLRNFNADAAIKWRTDHE